MVAWAYKWTDADILDLPLCRVRQLVEHIRRQQYEDLVVQTKITVWAVKNQSMVVAASSQMGKQGFRQISKSIAKMNLTPTDPKLANSIRHVDVNDMTEEQLAELVDGDIKLTPEQLAKNAKFTGV